MTTNLAASVQARLLKIAKANGEEFERTLVRFAAERWLYRLGQSSARDRFILKGASLLSVWLPDPHRTTRDVDLLGSGSSDETNIRHVLDEIASVPCIEDGLTFDLHDLEIEPIRADTEYVGTRALFLARLGKARIRMQVDIGFGDALSQGAERVAMPPMLPTLPSVSLRAYPREQSVAEKFEAMVRLDTRNGRMKDFHDIWALTGALVFDGARLRDAVASCFARRGVPWTSEPPPALTTALYTHTEMMKRWRGYVDGKNVMQPPPTTFTVIGDRIIDFLGPVREAALRDEPLRAVWQPGGPWIGIAFSGDTHVAEGASDHEHSLQPISPLGTSFVILS